MNNACYLYLIGDPEDSRFKYGISSNPDNRLSQIRSSEYMSDEGFPSESAKVCYLSPIMDRKIAREIEILWPLRHIRPFISYRSHKHIEIVKGELDDISMDMSLFIKNYDGL